MRRVLAASSAATLVAALAASAAASIVLRVTPRELADAAGLVVEGRVTAVDVRWNGDHSSINTYVSFNVERVHKGDTVGSVVVKVPGGRVGDEEMRVEGTAKFAVDDQAVVFLWKDAEGDWQVLGEAQGKFRLYTDAKTGARMAENSLQGLCLVVRSDPAAAKAAGTLPANARQCDRITRDDLVGVVRESVEEAKRKAAEAPKGTGGAASPQPGSGTPDAGTDAGRDPAPPVTTPDPPTTTKPSDGEAPPPTKDDPAPPAGDSPKPEDGETPPSTK